MRINLDNSKESFPIEDELKEYITKDSIFQVNYQGYATLFTSNVEGVAYVSENVVMNFTFRGRLTPDLDGTDFYSLTDWEINHILNTFDFKKINYLE